MKPNPSCCWRCKSFLADDERWMRRSSRLLRGGMIFHFFFFFFFPLHDQDGACGAFLLSSLALDPTGSPEADLVSEKYTEAKQKIK